MTKTFFVALSLLLCYASATPPLRQMIRRLSQAPEFRETVTNRTQWIEQPLDHFESPWPLPQPLDSRTWKQRYLVNESFFDGTGPVFLCVGGEGPGFTEDVVVTGTEHAHEMILAAQKHGALILALEHRYYGQSIPVDDFTTPNLRWLTSQQALADLADFVTMINEKYNLKAETNKWITFGGSYPGMMASFARVKYPHLIHASVASSAPVQAVENMHGYMNVMSDSFKLADVGGSQTCYDNIKDAFAEVGLLLNQGAMGRAALYKYFNVCKPDTDPLAATEQQLDFIESISMSFPAQGNDPLCVSPGCNIAKACSGFMANASQPSHPLLRLADFSKTILGLGDGCLPVDYEDDFVTPLLNTTVEGGGARIWTYQTCTAYGFYQTCDPGSDCIFGTAPHLNNLQSYYSLCQKAFNISGDEVSQAVKASNVWSGGWNPGASRVLYINGQVDPWRAQGVLPENKDYGKVVPVGGASTGILALMVQGSSHHYWTHAQIDPSPAILGARKAIDETIAMWLEH